MNPEEGARKQLTNLGEQLKATLFLTVAEHCSKIIDDAIERAKRELPLQEEEEEESSSSSSSSFIQDSDEEPEIYPDEVIQRDIVRRCNHTSRRRREEEEEEDLDEYDDFISKADIKECREFFDDFIAKRSYGAEGILQLFRNDPWFSKRYMSIIDAIAAQLGRDGHNKDAVANFDRIIAETAMGTEPWIIELEKSERGMKTCCLCNMSRRCTRSVIFGSNDNLPIGQTCSNLATTIITFFNNVATCASNCYKHRLSEATAIKKLNTYIGNVQEAHSNKRRRY